MLYICRIRPGDPCSVVLLFQNGLLIWAALWKGSSTHSEDCDQPRSHTFWRGPFAIVWNILQSRAVLYVVSEDPDQTAQIRRLLCTFAVPICTEEIWHVSFISIAFNGKFHSNNNIGLLHWCWWITTRVGTSRDTSLRLSVDIPTRDNIHQYQCNNTFYYIEVNAPWV